MLLSVVFLYQYISRRVFSLSYRINMYFEKWGICLVKYAKKASENITSALFALSNNKFENLTVWLENKT